MESTIERVPLNVNIPAPLRDELRSAVPKRQRSKFVVEAIETALRETNRQRALDFLDNLPRYDTKGQDSVEVLRRLRDKHTQRIIERHNPKAS